MARSDTTRSGWRGARGVRLTGGFLRRRWGGLLVVGLAIALVAAAIVVPGLKVNDARLNDGVIYVAKSEGALVGSLNLDSETLAQATSVGAANFRVIQSERTVVVASTGPNQLTAYDPATNQMSGPTNLPPNAVPSFGAGVMAVANPDNGRVWFGPVSQVLGTDFQQAKAQLEIGEQGLATVTTTGAVIALDVTESVLIRPAQQGQPASTVALPFTLEAQASVQLSAVGDRAVVLDRTGQRIWVEGMDQPVAVEAGASAELPPPSDTAEVGIPGATAVYATRAGLIALTSDGPRSLSGLINASVSQPIVVGQCIYGAFENRLVKRCQGQDQPQLLDIPEVPAQADLRFAANRGQVVLNDVTTGYIWLINQDMKLIKDWSQVTPAKPQDDDLADTTKNVVNPDRTKKNQPPTAKDDLTLRAREGRATVLPILDNDSDPDGDILTITEAPTLKGGVTADLISGGTGLQLTIPDGYAERIEFSYTVSDGRGQTASARVRVTPIAAEQKADNKAPEHFRPNEKLVLGQNQLGTKRTLLDWRDPDGDELILVDAELVGGTGDEVSFTSEGTLSFQDVGLTTGTKKVKLTVSDGLVQTEGELLVEVVKQVVPPQANGDQIKIRVGQDAVIDPLANDVGANLTLRELKVEGGSSELTVTPNYTDHTVKLHATKAGTYYVEYKVFNGQVSTGLIRVDVLPGGGATHRPVAARDAVLLPPGGSVLVDPLGNDFDDDGDVLVLQSVSSDDHLKVVMEQRRYLTITAETMPTTPITLTYLVSDGTYQTEGSIVVIPTPMTGAQKPKAVRDTVKARAGSIVSIPVLANDSSPVGLPLSLDQIVEAPAGRAWLDGDRIRVQVPATATGMSLTYQIRDSEGQTDSATVEVTVVSPDAQNEQPVPGTVEARVLSGSSSKIQIPLDGIDPNGDPVRLLGLHSGPSKGRITEVGEYYLTYEAFDDSQGTDSFEYEVVDSLGAVGVAEVRVGVAPAAGINTPPTGIDDTLTVRPGRPVRLPLLANDYDADGDSFGLVPDNPVDFEVPATVVDDTAISFTSPTTEGSLVGTYYLKDARGAIGGGTILVTVDPAAPNLPPVAVDDTVAVSEIIGKDSIEVQVTGNDYDPDGPTDKLTVAVTGQEQKASPVTVNQAQRSLSIPVGQTTQQVRYTITDAEGGTASAVVTVPGRQDERPRLRDPKAQLTVVAGEPVTIKLKDYIQGSQGRSVTLTNVDNVWATTGRPLGATGQLTWTPDVKYAGPAAIVFEVVDQVPAGDKTAKRAVITIPATIKPAPNVKKQDDPDSANLNQPPQPAGAAAVMKVGAGEPEARFDISPYFKDPEGQDFAFQDWQGSTSGPISWRVGDGGSTIQASAGEAVPPGTSLQLKATVIDAGGANNQVSMTITVVGSTRPRPTTVTDVVDDGVAGQKTVVNVLANDKSNLLKDQTLYLVGQKLLSGKATVEAAGENQVAITPDKGYVGTVTVSYTVVDATKDPSRHTDGLIKVTVRDKPGKPGVPVKQQVGDGQVTIKWTDGELNGLPLTSRVVTATSTDGGTNQTQSCASNTCTITGLTNGKNYRFTVAQSNSLGSATSDASSPMRPDVKPNPPGQPQVDFRDGALALTWSAASSKGSPVTGYRVTMVGSGKTMSTSGTSLVWPDLNNGVTYTFTVAASNSRSDDSDGVTGWSDESAVSAPQHPTGPPGAPVGVTATDDGSKNQGGWLNITWAAPPSSPPTNVDPITGYDVYARHLGDTSRGKLIASMVDPNSRKLSWGEARNNQKYQFIVVAHNRSPVAGADSAPSDPVSSFGAPDAPNGAKISAQAGQITVDMIPDTSAGKPVERWNGQLYRDGKAVGSQQEVRRGTVITGLTNGDDYSLEIRGVAGGKTGSPAMTNTVTPRGQVGQVSIVPSPATKKGNQVVRSVKLELPKKDSNGTYNGNDASQVELKYQVDGGEWKTVSSGTTVDIVVGNSAMTIRAMGWSKQTGDGVSTERPFAAPLVATANQNDLKISLSEVATGSDGKIWCQISSNVYQNPGAMGGSGSVTTPVIIKVTGTNPSGLPDNNTPFTVSCGPVSMDLVYQR